MTAVPYLGRFAPSPTGPLHLGSLVAALASWLDARAAGGHWLVRMEDVDRPRCDPHAAATILRQLEAYGLGWDGPVLYQSQRSDAYDAALAALRADGAVFACTCTRSQLVHARRNADGEIVYPGTCRLRPQPSGRHAVRVRVETARLVFEDRIHGRLEQNLAHDVGDFVVARADGFHAYQLAVIVDDGYQGVTHVVRGADLLWNTPRQIYLQRLLGLPTPTYAHVPLITNAAGQKLSKQSLAPALPERDRRPVLEQALAALGHAPPVDLVGAGPDELLRWAVGTWRIERVPLRPVIANATQGPDNPPLAPSP